MVSLSRADSGLCPLLSWDDAGGHRPFGGCNIEAQRRTAALAKFLIDKTKLLDRLRGQMNERQEKALSCMFRVMPDKAIPGILYRSSV